MPRYFFDVDDAIGFTDPDGVDLPDIAAAKDEAIRHFGEILSENSEAFSGDDEWQMRVRNPHGLILLTFSFSMSKSPATIAMAGGAHT